MSFSTFNTFQSIIKNYNLTLLRSDTIVNLNNGLLFWYQLKSGDINGSNLLYNSANSSYDATYISNVSTPSFSTTIKKIYSSSIYLSIANLSYIKLPAINLTINNAYTISFWARQTNPTGKNSIALTCYGATSNPSNVMLLCNSDGHYMYNGGFYWDKLRKTYNNDSTWHNYVIIFGKSTCGSLYIDNVLSSVINGTNINTYTSVNALFNYIGHIDWDPQNINAYISDYRLYDRKLNTNEITALYNMN